MHQSPSMRASVFVLDLPDTPPENMLIIIAEANQMQGNGAWNAPYLAWLIVYRPDPGSVQKKFRSKRWLQKDEWLVWLKLACEESQSCLLLKIQLF